MSNKKEQSNNQEYLLPTSSEHSPKQTPPSESATARRGKQVNKISGPQMFIITLVIALIAIIFLFPLLRGVMVPVAPPQPTLPSSFELTPTPRVQRSDEVVPENPVLQIEATVDPIALEGYRNSEPPDRTGPIPILPTVLQPETIPGVVAGSSALPDASSEVIPAEETFEFTLLSELSSGSQVWDLAFSSDSNALASGASNGIVTVWKLENLGPSDGIELQILADHSGPVRSVAFHPQDPNRLISGSADHTVILWDLESSQPTMTFSDHTDEVSSVALSPDGKQLVSGSADGTVKLWNMESGSLISTFTEHEEWVLSVTFDPIHNRLATGAADNTIRIWNLDTFQELYAFEGHDDWVSALSFSSNGTRLASGSYDNSVLIWDVDRRRSVLPSGQDAPASAISSVAFHPDGRILAAGTHGKVIFVWDLEKGTSLTTLTGHAEIVRTIAFSPNGKLMASAADDGIIRVWSIRSYLILGMQPTESIGS